MTKQRTPKIEIRVLSAFSLFIAVLTVLIAFAAPAQQTGAGQPSAESSTASAPVQASTPVRVLSRTMLPGTANAQRVSAARSQSKEASSAAPDGANPLFLPAVTYDSGGGGGQSMAIADLNGDGKPDLIVAQGGESILADGSVGVLLGNGDGTFKPAVVYDSGGHGADSIVIADVNGDGKPDLIVANPGCGTSGGCVGVLLGNGDGTFQPVATYWAGVNPILSLLVVVADVNGDGKPDLIVANAGGESDGDGSVGVLLGNGDGTFQPVVTYDSGGVYTFSVAVSDVNGDGIPDLLAASGDGAVGVLLGNGDGTFQPATIYDSGSSSTTFAVADLNGDGRPDIVTTTTPAWVSVLLNNGDGTFQPAVTYRSGGLWPTALVITDLNGDGIPDLVVKNECGINCTYTTPSSVGVLLGNGDGTFSYTVNYNSSGGSPSLGPIAVADINGDGKPDVLVTNNYCTSNGCQMSTLGVLLGRGDGALQPVQSYSTGGWESGLAVADLNGDGKPDAVALNGCGDASCDSTVGVLLNNTARPYNPTTTTLVSNANPAIANQVVTYTATVTSLYGGTATRTVTFSDGTKTLGSVPLSSNQAAYSVSYRSVGHHTITAAYSGDADNGFSTSAALTEDVAVLPVLSTTVVTTSGSPSLIGQPVTFTATVTWSYGTIPNGETVTFYDDGTAMGTGPTAGGVAAFTTSSLTVKTHTIKANYAGDATFKPSSGTVKQIVNGYATSTTLTSGLNPSIYGQSLTWTATVTTSGSVPPAGIVNFTWDGYSIGEATLNASGVATLARRLLDAGSYPLTAVYKGDAYNARSTSAILNQVIQETTSAATISSSPNPSTQGELVTFTAKITSPTVTPKGPVTFTAGETVLGTVELTGEKAQFTTSTLPVGSTKVTATYYGDSNIAKSSASVTQTVQQ